VKSSGQGCTTQRVQIERVALLRIEASASYIPTSYGTIPVGQAIFSFSVKRLIQLSSTAYVPEQS